MVAIAKQKNATTNIYIENTNKIGPHNLMDLDASSPSALKLICKFNGRWVTKLDGGRVW